MTDQETAIREMYDSNPDLTLEQLSRITRLSVKQLKKILLEDWDTVWPRDEEK